MSFLKALSRVGLVELSDKELQQLEAKKAARRSSAKAASSSTTSTDDDALERLLQETQETLAAAEEPVVSPPVDPTVPAQISTPEASSTAVEDGVLEGRSFAEIYTASGVQDAPFTVEKLLKVLEGLEALPMSSRKAAVLALDAADDAWSIADVILDAQRKGRALREEQSRLSNVVAQAEAQAAQDIATADSYLQAATEHIRQQIAELEAALAAEVQQVTEQKAGIRSSLASTRDAVARTHTRLEAEATRLAQVPVHFGDSAISG